VGGVKIGLGADHAGYRHKERIKAELLRLGHEVRDFGADNEQPSDYPDYALPLARAVAGGDIDRAIWVCGTGLGGTLTAGGVAGVRAACCSEATTARYSRSHNDANFLALGQRIIGEEVALDIVRTWLQTEFSGEERHRRRLDKVARISGVGPECA
jgi:ribose 5-phosphate isomerase B